MPDRPRPVRNVLVVTLDELRGDCVGSDAHPVRTPALDRLAAEGVHLVRHHGQAVPCAPGRACLYTGTYQSTNRVVANGTPLDDRFDNLARVGRRAGFRPTLFGYTDAAVDPRTVDDPADPRLTTYEGVLPGFDVELDLTGDQAPWVAWLEQLGHDLPGGIEAVLASEPDRPAEHGISAFLTDRFLEWHRRQDGPWFAHLSYLRPHPPFAAAGEWSRAYDPDAVDLPVPPPPPGRRHPLHDLLLSIPVLTAPTEERELRHLRAQYYGMVGDVDHQLGRVWDALAAAGQWDDTWVLVTADHGEQLGDQGLVQKFGWFGPSYHVPAIVRDPSRPAAHGTVVERFTEHVDVLPTLCEALGVDVPAQCDGRALTPFLDGGEPDGWRTATTYEFDWRIFVPRGAGWPEDRRRERAQLTVHLDADSAYVQFADGDSLLYDLAADPTWTTVVDDPRRALDHARALLAWRAEHLDRTVTDTLIGPPTG